MLDSFQGGLSVKKKFVKYARAMESDWNRVFVRRMMWADMEERVRKLFKEIEGSPQAEWYGGIRVHRGLHSRAEEIPVNQKLNQLQITCMTKRLGLRSVEEFEETQNIDGVDMDVSGVRLKTHVENGAVMWFSQSPSGGVTVFMAPCKSDLVSFNEKEIILGMYKDPSVLSDEKIKDLSAKFFRYASITSALHRHTIFDYYWRLRLQFLDVRNRKIWKTFIAINALIIFGAAFFTVLGYFLNSGPST